MESDKIALMIDNTVTITVTRNTYEISWFIIPTSTIFLNISGIINIFYNERNEKTHDEYEAYLETHKPFVSKDMYYGVISRAVKEVAKEYGMI